MVVMNCIRNLDNATSVLPMQLWNFL